MSDKKDILGEVFDIFLKKTFIFKDKQKLHWTWIPTEDMIFHREKHIKTIAPAFVCLLKNNTGVNNIFVYGKPGTGKTMITKLLIKKTREIQPNNNYNIVYISCKQYNTEFKILSHLGRELNLGYSGTYSDRYYKRLINLLGNKKLLVILDEIDKLGEHVNNVLFNFNRINEDLGKNNLGILAITNDLSITTKLEPRTKSGLSGQEVIFKPYNALQLQDILRKRSEVGFNNGVLEPGVIEKCAALSAQEHGDARRALDLLRVAGELAERNSDEKVGIKHVDAAEEIIDIDLVIEMVKSQPRQSQMVLWSLLVLSEKNNEMQTKDIYDNYLQKIKGSGLKPLTQRRVYDLIAELDMLGLVTTKILFKGRYGRTRMVSLNFSDIVFNKVKNYLEELLL